MKPLKKTIRPPEETPPKRGTLLYVEDDDGNWRVALAGLVKDYNVLRARDAREACTHVRARNGDFFAILMDIELQGSDFNGVELAKILGDVPIDEPLPEYAQNLPPVSAPILFVTAYGNDFTPEKLASARGAYIIAKPVDFLELMGALTRAHLATANESMGSINTPTKDAGEG